MPFKSKAQVRKFGQLLHEGKITKEQFDEWHASTPNIKKLPNRVKKKKKKTMEKAASMGGFTGGFEKVSGVLSKNLKPIMGMSHATAKKVYNGLEYGGLGALAALDLHEAHKAKKEGDKAGVRKGLIGAGALGTLMAGTYLGSKIH